LYGPTALTASDKELLGILYGEWNPDHDSLKAKGWDEMEIGKWSSRSGKPELVMVPDSWVKEYLENVPL